MQAEEVFDTVHPPDPPIRLFPLRMPSAGTEAAGRRVAKTGRQLGEYSKFSVCRTGKCLYCIFMSLAVNAKGVSLSKLRPAIAHLQSSRDPRRLCHHLGNVTGVRRLLLPRHWGSRERHHTVLMHARGVLFDTPARHVACSSECLDRVPDREQHGAAGEADNWQRMVSPGGHQAFEVDGGRAREAADAVRTTLHWRRRAAPHGWVCTCCNSMYCSSP